MTDTPKNKPPHDDKPKPEIRVKTDTLTGKGKLTLTLERWVLEQRRHG